MKRVVIESPYAGDVFKNMEYFARCCRDCLDRGESPYGSHGFFPFFLDDNDPEERKLGIDAGLAWSEAAESIAVYTDFGISPGMQYAIEKHKEAGRVIEYRSLEGENA